MTTNGNSHFHNFFLNEKGAHLSISTAVTMGLIAPGPQPNTVIIHGQKVSVQMALDAGIIDTMAAEYLASLPPANTIPMHAPTWAAQGTSDQAVV